VLVVIAKIIPNIRKENIVFEFVTNTDAFRASFKIKGTTAIRRKSKN
jgi:hypothetical protein